MRLTDNEVLSIAGEYKTPLYLYEASQIKLYYNKLKASLPPGAEIFYSMKCNPLLGICEYMRCLGSGVEVASGGELHIALMAGFNPEDIIFTGPGKTEAELNYAVKENIYCINIESMDELPVIEKLGRKFNRRIRTGIRVNPDFNLSGAALNMSGVASQFGIDQSQLGECLQRIKGSAHVELTGLHIYSGTQILNSENLAANIEAIVKLAVAFFQKNNLPLKVLDVGGGFGIAYFPDEQELDLADLTLRLNSMWNEYKGELSGTRLIVESGRFLMADSGRFLTKILYKKKCKDTEYLVCDGGSNFHASSAFLGRFIRGNYRIKIVGERKADTAAKYTIVGPLCTPTDVIGQNITLSNPEVGDIISIEQSGAYGLTNSPYYFLGHLTPVEVIVADGKKHILRQRGEVHDLVYKQKKNIF